MGGSASSPSFDGAGLAAKDVVVVAINYRLGVLGFLAHPELTAESGHNSSGNYGLLDQIVALTWVKNNIAAFGGNPKQVTIGGQSAGASSVYQLVNSPLAAGLISGAIIQSGVRHPGDPQISGLATSYRTLSTAEAQGVNYSLQLNAPNIAAMRALDLVKLIANSGVNDNVFGGPPLFRPVLEGYVIPRTYHETLESGPANDVPILTGNNKDESGGPNNRVTVAQYTPKNQLYYGDFSDRYFQLYPGSNQTQAEESTTAAGRDASGVGTWRWQGLWSKAAKSPVYTYHWDHAPPAKQGRYDTVYAIGNLITNSGPMKGAYHGSEISYTFNNLYAQNPAWTDQDRAIATKMSDYWSNFIKTGNPNGGGLTTWAKTSQDPATTMRLGNAFGPMQLASPERTRFHTEFFAHQKQW
jgi:carboxylesterase 2